MRSEYDTAFNTPAYSIRQASQYVGVPYQTLRNWTGPGGLISLAAHNALSFNNLAEAHVLKAMRRRHNLSLQSIRKALLELAQRRSTFHPLLDETFGTDGVSLCIYEEGKIVNLTRRSQEEIAEVAQVYLHRIDRDRNGRATMLYPFVTHDKEAEPRNISITPVISFGRPVLAGTGISTSVIAGRFTARDSVEMLAQEYQVETHVLEDAIRWEMLKGKAA